MNPNTYDLILDTISSNIKTIKNLILQVVALRKSVDSITVENKGSVYKEIDSIDESVSELITHTEELLKLIQEFSRNKNS